MQALSYYGSVIADLGFALSIVYSVALLGRSVRLVLPTVDWSSPVSVLWDVYIGAISAAILTTVLGMIGFFTPRVFAGVLATGPLLNFRNADAFVAPWRAIRESVSLCRGQILLSFALMTSVAIAVVPTAVPEIFYDALYYHLGLPWQYVMAGEIQWLPSVVHSAFPAYLDVLFGICLGLGGPGVAKFFNLLLFIIGWCAAAAFVYEVLGDKRAAIVGAVTVSTIPGVVVMSTMCAIDAALIGFVAMAALALARMQHSGPNDLKPLALLAALNAGFVGGSKYTGLWLIGVLALSILVHQRPLLAVRTAVLFIGCAILVASPWYVRNLVVIGDPIYPVLSGYLGDGGAGWAIERIQRDVPASGLSWVALKDLVLGLMQNHDRFGAGAQPGLLMPLGFVALLVGALRVPHLRPWTVAAVTYGMVWLSQASVMRYIYPIFPFFALGAAWVACHVLARLRYPAFGTAVLVMVALAPLSQSVRVLDSLYVGSDVAALVSGTLSKDDYLARRLAYYPAVRWLNAHAPSDAHVLYLGETRLLYLDRPVRFSSAYDYTEIARLMGPDAPPLFSQLRNLGITHILINGREIERLRAAYEYLPLPVDAEQRLRAALVDCQIVFRKFGVQVCELPRQG